MKKIIRNKDSDASQNMGGKAKNLKRLQSLGLNVPTWIVIPAEVMTNQMKLNPEGDFSSEELNQLKIPDTVITEIEAYFGVDAKQKSYAVRSSALDEDGADFSFAGQFETFLHVPFSEIEVCIKKVWKSAASEHMLTYRKQHGLDAFSGVGVIVQEMIPSDVSGVAFGIDPLNGDQQTKCISAVYGLGEGLVSGELDADSFWVKNGEIKSRIAQKTHRLDRGGLSGVKTTAVASELQDVPVLTDRQILEISEVLKTLEKELNGPQDIEFAYFQSQLILLQTRPVTAIQKGEYILWDNSNIVESYPGITTPLTFTFILKMYDRVYRQFVALMGVHDSEIERHKEVFAHTLGLVRGRVYYNLLNWYKMLAMLPGYSINAEYMENMMGVKERFELGDDFQLSKGKARWRIFVMIFKMISKQIALPRERKKFMRHLNQVMRAYNSIDFDALSPKQIISKYKEFETSLLLEWKAPLINDFFAMIWFGMLQKQGVKYFSDDPNIHNDLLCGSRDIISVEPIHRSMHLAKIIRENEEAFELFSNGEASDIWEKMKTGRFQEIKKKFDEYLEDFGERCVGELKLETISYSQDPIAFVKIIQSYVQQNITASSSNIENELRQKAEEKVDVRFKGKPTKKWWFNFVKKKARDLVSNRENLRYERTRGFGQVRIMLSVLGKKWSEMSILADGRDVFFLKLEEILAYNSTGFPEDVRALVDQRKQEFKAYENQEIPMERFFTYGHDFSDQYIYSTEKLDPIQTDLEGIGCCPGRVQGKVMVIKDPKEVSSLEGNILVTSSTDPGWVTLFPSAAAIVVERGSLLSHSAIVSREMGIPCIVSVKGLLRSLKTGDEIKMDGSTGKIEVVK